MNTIYGCCLSLFCKKDFFIPVVEISVTLSSLWGPCLRAHLLLISWSINQGEKPTSQLAERPQLNTFKSQHSFCCLFPFRAFTFLSLLSLVPYAGPSFMWNTIMSCLWYKAPGTLGHISPVGPRSSSFSYLPSARCCSTMLTQRKFVHYVMSSLIIYPPLSFH